MGKPLRMFNALPAYFGGKRRLLGRIFRHIPPPSAAPVLADPFLGGGAVSLYAKARGYRVVCNDVAQRSYVVGRGLIENDRVTLGAEDVLRLFAEARDEPGFVETYHCPAVVTQKHARFLDGALVAARQAEEPKRSLLMLLIVKYLLRQRPMGNLGARTIIEQANDGRWDEINPSFVRGTFIDRVVAHPKRHAEIIRQQVNRGVFGGAGPCRAYQLDVLDFLGRIEADAIYMDPPYAGTSSYEGALNALDEILAGKSIDPQKSAFSGPRWLDALTQMFEAAKHIPTWILSFGNAATDLETLVALMRRFKPHVEAEAIDYAHCASLANEDTRARNREFIIVGRPS